VICYTLDLEHDYAGVAPAEAYEAFSNGAVLKRLSDLVRRHDLRLTVFATGQVLEGHEEMLSSFQEMGAEIELHGYDHILDSETVVREMHRGMSAYQKRFGRSPLGYRAPGGVLSPTLMQELAAAGIRYDSSVIPSFRWGMYSNLHSPLGPHLYPNLSLVELPIGVVPCVRLLISASYIRLVGLSLYKFLFNLFGIPSPAVYLFHLVDLISVDMRKHLSKFLRYAYMRGDGKGLNVFEASVKYFERKGYRPVYMSDVYNRYLCQASSMAVGGRC
jgi:hypothetical protein